MPRQALSMQAKPFFDLSSWFPTHTHRFTSTLLFDDISENTLQNLLSHSRMAITKKGSEIVQQGDTVDFLYFIIEGRIRVLRSNPEGDETTNNLLQDGETFMESVIFMGGVSPVRAKAVTDSKLLLIPAAAISQLVLQDAQLGLNLLRIISIHQKEAWQQLDCIVTKSPVERLGYYALKLLIEVNPDTVDIELPFQKNLIANYLGMTPETFSRALKKLRAEGVDVENGYLILRNFFSLCRFCDADTAAVCPKYRAPGCAAKASQSSPCQRRKLSNSLA